MNIEHLSKQRLNTREDKLVSISIPSRTHQKLTNLCWLLRKNKKPKIGVVTNNIIEQFIDDYRDQIL